MNWPINLKYINSYYATGWRVLRLKGKPNKELIFHSGYINGYKAYIGYIPNEKIGFIMMVNQATEIPVEDGMKLWSIYRHHTSKRHLAQIRLQASDIGLTDLSAVVRCDVYIFPHQFQERLRD